MQKNGLHYLVVSSHQEQMMGTVVFAPAFYNLAETTRMVEIAKASRAFFDILFISYGGQFEDVVRKEGFDIRPMEPRLTPEKIAHIYAVDKGEKMGDIFTVEELDARVAHEIAFMQAVKPAAVVSGFCLSVYVSTRAAGVPFVAVINSTWLPQFYDAGLATWPDMLDFPITRIVPEKLLNWLMKQVILRVPFFVKPFNVVARRHGVKPFKTMGHFFLGDHSLVADIPEFAGMSAGPNEHFIGPLIGRLDIEIPEAIRQIPKDQPIVYFAMGSSGTAEIIADILPAFAGKPYRVIAPVKALLDGMDVETPPNVIATDWLPAHKVNPMADISVIHGGIGTVMTACLSGTPLVGVGMQPEQEANIDCLVRKGFAIRIRKRRVTAGTIIDAIDRLRADEAAKQKAKAFQKLLEKWDGPANAARFLHDAFG